MCDAAYAAYAAIGKGPKSNGQVRGKSIDAKKTAFLYDQRPLMTDGRWPLAYDLQCERRGQGEHGCMASWLTVQGRKASVPQANERLFPLAPKSRLLGPGAVALLAFARPAARSLPKRTRRAEFSVQRPASSVQRSVLRVQSREFRREAYPAVGTRSTARPESSPPLLDGSTNPHWALAYHYSVCHCSN